MNRIFLSMVLLPVVSASFGQDILKATDGSVITVQSGASLFVRGGIVLDNNSTFNNAGIVTIARTKAAGADLTDNSSVAYNYGAGKFVFIGPGVQNIKSINQFERVDVENTGLNLLSDITSHTWYLNTGKVNTGSFMAIANTTAASAIQADVTNVNFTNSWINGSLRRYIAPASVNNYQFPVGNDAKVNMAEMDNLTGNPLTGITYVTASFGTKPGTDVGLNASESGAAYTSINNGGVWHIIPNANASGGKYDMKLFFNGFTGLADNSFGILRRTDISSNAVDWMVPAGSALPANGSAGRTVAGNYARRNGVTAFGQFAIGSSGAALPLQLLSFTAIKKDRSVVLQWVTGNEVNTSHFELYRAGQPVPLQYLDKIAAAGSSVTSLHYSYTDMLPLKGTGFYQLKMIDKDNSYKLSNILKVNFDENTSFTVYPNPITNNMLFVRYNGGKINNIQLIAVDGKQISCNYNNQSNNLLKVTLPASIAKGTYQLRLLNDEGIKSTMIVIQ